MVSLRKWISLLTFGVLIATLSPLSLVVAQESDDADTTTSEESTSEDTTTDSVTDLQVQDLFIAPDDHLVAVLSNEGEDDVDPSQGGSIDYYLEGELQTSYTWSLYSDADFFDAGGETHVVFDEFSGSGDVQVCIVSDGYSDCLAATLDSEVADLTIEQVEVDEDFMLSITLANVGDMDVPSTTEFLVNVWIDDELVWSWDASAADNKSFFQIDGETLWQPQLLTGSHDVIVEIDPDDNVFERNEYNNRVEVSFDLGQPDLVMGDVVYNDSTGEVQVTLSNDSDVIVESTSSGQLYLWVDDSLVESHSFSSLADEDFLEPQGTSTLTLETLLEGGENVEVCVDALDAISETDEDNNCFEGTLGDSAAQLYVESAGVEDESSAFYANVCNDSDTHSGEMAITFAANGYDNALTYSSGISAEACTTLYSWGLTTFGVEDGETYTLEVSVSNDAGQASYSTSVEIPTDETDSIGDVTVEVYVVEETEVSDLIETVEEQDFVEQVFEDFQDFWGDVSYSDAMIMTVRWGHFGGSTDELSGVRTDWDGAVYFDGDLVGRPMELLRFEDGEDWVDFEATDPTMTTFYSTIASSNDGIRFKLRVAPDSEEEKAVRFVADFLDEEIELNLEELEEHREIVVYADGDEDSLYQVIFQSWSRDQWVDRLNETALLEVRVGNLDGEGSEGEDGHRYSVSLAASEGSEIRGYMPVLMEEHVDEFDGYDQLVRNADKDELTLDAGILGHFDGFLALLDVVDSEAGDRYVELTVTDNDTGDVVFDQTFTDQDEFGIFELDDGTGNKLSIKNLFRNRSHYAHDADHIFAGLRSWIGSVADFSDILENLVDEGLIEDDIREELEYRLEDFLGFIPTEDSGASLGLLQHNLSALTKRLETIYSNYTSGDIDEDKVNEKVEFVLDRFLDALDSRFETAQVDAGHMVDADYEAWYGGYMDNSLNHGFFGGYRDAEGNLTGRIGPGDSLTRFQLIKIMFELSGVLDRGFGATDCDPSDVEYSDDTDWLDDHWARGYVQCLVDEGAALSLLDEVVAESLDSGTQSALRWEVVQTAIEMLEIEEEDFSEFSLSDLSESDLSDKVKDQIETLVQLGVVAGHPDGRFAPYDPVNRAQMFKITDLLYQVYDF